MRIQLTLLFFLFTHILFAQGVALEQVTGIGNSQVIFDLEEDYRGNIWIASDAGLYKVEGKRPIPVVKGKPALALATDKSASYAIFQNMDIYKSGKYHFRLEDKNVKVLCMEAFDNKLWIGTKNNGVLVYGIRNKKLLDHFTKKNSKLESNTVNFIHSDKDRLVWIGTTKGVVRVDGDKWKTYEKKYNMVAMAESSEELWLLAEDEMWQIHTKGKRWEPLHVNEGWKQGRINDFIVDKEKKIYIASQKLTRVDPYTDTEESFADAMAFVSKECLSLLADRNNNVWFGTKKSGLFVTEFGLEDNYLSAIYTVEQDFDCEGVGLASISVKISGGEAPFSLNWSDDSIEGLEPENVKPGVYSLEIKDASDQSFNLEIDVSQADPLELSISDIKRITKPGKSDGQARIEISGGTYPYEVKWLSGEKNMMARKLPVGEQTVTVIDDNGCEEVLAFEIEKSKILSELDIDKVTEGQTLRINQLYFEADSSVITSESHEVLDEIYSFLTDNPNILVEIGGHTNNIPPHEYCDRLSTARAKSIASYLYSKGVSDERVAYRGYGKRNPISSNATAAGRAKNQRVEIKILKIL